MTRHNRIKPSEKMEELPYYNMKDLIKLANQEQVVRLTSSLTVSTSNIEKVAEKPKSTRCSHTDCKKKLMLTDLTCKCGQRYCIGHRFPEIHSCKFDYKASGLSHLSTMLVKVSADTLKSRI